MRTFILIIIFFIHVLHSENGFHPSKIHSDFPYEPNWETDSLTNENLLLNEILSQKFHYLGNGAQCYAFISQDQKYVLKFFKMKHLLAKKWLNYFPFSCFENYRFRKVDRREQRLNNTFAAFKMAYENFKEHAALVFIHLNSTNHLNKKITLVDKHKKEWSLDLDSTVFILQEKADLVYSRIQKLIDSGNIQEAKFAMQAVLQLVHSRCQKGFVDLDSGFNNNYGFVGNRPVQIDIGRISQDESCQNFAEVDKLKRNMTKWLKHHYPDLILDL